MESRRGAPVILVAAAIIVICAGVKLAGPVVVPLFLAGFIATVTAPLVLKLISRGLKRGLAVTIGVFVDLAAITGLALLVGGSLTAFTVRLPQYEERLRDLALRSAEWLVAHGVEVSIESIMEIVDPSWMVGMFATLLQGVASALSRVVLVVLIVAFMLVEAAGLRGKLARLVRDRSAITTLGKAADEVNTYVLVKLATSSLTGLLAAACCGAFGVDLPILWGLLAFLLNFIPTIGSIVAAVPPMVLALLQFGPGAMAGVGVGYLVINFAIGSLLEPRLMGRVLGLSPLVVFLSMVFWGYLLGPVGALLSAPLTMIVRTYFGLTEDLRWLAILLGPTVDPVEMSDENERVSDDSPTPRPEGGWRNERDSSETAL